MNNALLSAFAAALSGTFPPGEAEFIASVRLYRDRITDPELQEQIRGFIGQEGHHSHQHRKANEALAQLGWDAQYVEQALAKSIVKRNASERGGQPKFRLALTTCVEHLTAIMSEFILTTPEVFEDIDPRITDLLNWHAVEEIEHKAVAFDVYMQCEGDQAYLRKMMRLATTLFVSKIAWYILVLLFKAGKLPRWSEIREAYEFMFGEKVLITKIKRPWQDYFKPDFHPWEHDNRALIEGWKAKYEQIDV